MYYERVTARMRGGGKGVNLRGGCKGISLSGRAKGIDLRGGAKGVTRSKFEGGGCHEYGPNVIGSSISKIDSVE